LLALEFREQTGEGQQVDVSVQACLPLTLMVSMPEFYATGALRQPRVGDGHPSALNGMFSVRDGYVDVRFRGRPTQWEQLIAWMDAKGMADDLLEECWRDPEYRREPENAHHIDEVFQRFLLQFDREEAMDTSQRNGVETGAVYTAEDLLRDPQLHARNFFVEVEHDELGKSFIYPGAPYSLSETPWRLRQRAPLLGEHNLEVYEGELGITRDQLASLRAAGVI
jgi:benzylsuccinate CoA-transferase BbsE subunit